MLLTGRCVSQVPAWLGGECQQARGLYQRLSKIRCFYQKILEKAYVWQVWAAFIIRCNHVFNSLIPIQLYPLIWGQGYDTLFCYAPHGYLVTQIFLSLVHSFVKILLGVPGMQWEIGPQSGGVIFFFCKGLVVAGMRTLLQNRKHSTSRSPTVFSPRTCTW